MRTNKRTWRMVLAVMLIAVAVGWGSLVGQAAAAKTYQMKITLAVAKDAQDQIAHIYADKINEASNGRIKATVYNGGQLGNIIELFQGVQLGTIEMVIGPTAFMAPAVPQIGILDLPFLFQGPDEAFKVLNSSAMDSLKELAGDKRYVLAGFFPLGFKSLVTRFPVETADDLKGKKFRAFTAPEIIRQFELWGASAVPTALSEVYVALQQGVIDGLDNPPDATYRSKHQEVADYFTVTRHGAVNDVMAVSKVWLDRLPKDLQDVVLNTAQEILPEAHRIAKKAQSDSLQKLKGEMTVTTLPDEELNRLKAAVQPLYETERADKVKGPLLKELEAYLSEIR